MEGTSLATPAHPSAAVAENPAWVALFGQEATDKLAAATHGGAAP